MSKKQHVIQEIKAQIFSDYFKLATVWNFFEKTFQKAERKNEQEQLQNLGKLCCIPYGFNDLFNHESFLTYIKSAIHSKLLCL